MKKLARIFLALSTMLGALAAFGQGTFAQTGVEEFTGNIISFNGPRVQIAPFTLKINRWTTDEQANNALAILQANGRRIAL